MINAGFLANAARKLDSAGVRYAFVGGSIVEFLLDYPDLSPVRATDDLDVIVEIMAAQHYSDIEDALRRVGFRHDISQGAPICRWLLDNMIIDIMPTEGMLIGLNTQWFAEALASSTYKCINGVQVPIISPVSFIATKLAAFADRGREDYYGSHDLEDIVAVIDGRAEIVAEIDKDVEALKRYVVNGIQSLWRSNEFQESLAGHLPPDSASQARLPGLRKKLRAIVALE